MAAISLTPVTLNNTTTRLASNKVRNPQGSFYYQTSPIPVRTHAGVTGTTSTDTATVNTTTGTYFVRIMINSTTTGTIAAGSLISQQTGDTQGLLVPALAAGGFYDSDLIPVAPGSTVVLTTGTLATAASTVRIIEYGLRPIDNKTTV